MCTRCTWGVAAGDSRDEVEKLVQEALTFHLAALREDDQPLPQPGLWAGLVEIDEQEVARLTAEFAHERCNDKVRGKRKLGTLGRNALRPYHFPGQSSGG